ncbi:pentapeptide repeat-containing protein [Methylibium sp. T29]|uniref:pentapeptide repeat-containing protein n=1 Tax=Methylibium sp. T29 TaxID=1430884 RepID=UPI0004B5285E|nr:pentapeptide repeat-containing protein [Methylibium sp. T29]
MLVTLTAALAGVRPVQATEDDGNAAAPDYLNGCGIWPHTRCPGVDLRGADLSARNLAGADLRGANLAGADLRVANLAGANLDGANLAGAKLGKINAPTATFRGANLAGATWSSRA